MESPEVFADDAEPSSAVRTRVTSFDARRLLRAVDSSDTFDLSRERDDES